MVAFIAYNSATSWVKFLLTLTYNAGQSLSCVHTVLFHPYHASRKLYCIPISRNFIA